MVEMRVARMKPCWGGVSRGSRLWEEGEGEGKGGAHPHAFLVNHVGVIHLGGDMR